MTHDGRGAVVLENLSKHYQSIKAIRDVSLSAEPGQFVTLLGPSGSGKTTTLMAIAGFTIPSSGRILLDGQDITWLPPNRRNLGMVFQHYALFPNMTVAQNVAFPLAVRRRPKVEIDDRVGAALQMVKLDEFGQRYPRQLSGGQQQRVALARAIVFAPNVLLMDEPLGALDKNLRDHMQSEIRRIHQELKTTVFYVTHDQEEALSMSDVIVVMRDGGIEQIGTPKELYEHPRNAFVATFIGGANVLRGTLERNGEAAALRHASGQLLPIRLPDGAAGSQISIAVRPEKMRLHGSDAAGEGRLSGVLREVTYLGGMTRLRVAIGEDEIGMVVTSHSGVDLPAQGQRLGFGWDEDAAVHLSD